LFYLNDLKQILHTLIQNIGCLWPLHHLIQSLLRLYVVMWIIYLIQYMCNINSNYIYILCPILVEIWSWTMYY